MGGEIRRDASIDLGVFVTREELSERLWPEPPVKEVARYGVSNAAVAMWCRTLKVSTASAVR